MGLWCCFMMAAALQLLCCIGLELGGSRLASGVYVSSRKWTD